MYFFRQFFEISEVIQKNVLLYTPTIRSDLSQALCPNANNVHVVAEPISHFYNRFITKFVFHFFNKLDDRFVCHIFNELAVITTVSYILSCQTESLSCTGTVDFRFAVVLADSKNIAVAISEVTTCRLRSFIRFPPENP